MKTGRYFAAILLIVAIACNTPSKPTLSFEKKLSTYQLFSGKLLPAQGVEVMEISSTLFTDYAEKQRLIKVPAGKKAIVKGNGLLLFPEGTIIAKTFYYSASDQLIETRLLILKDEQWNAATYRWDEDQQDATLLTAGAVVPVSLGNKKLAYKIPAQSDCGSCHQSGNELSPIGPKAVNLNMPVFRDGIRQNQLMYLMNKGIIAHADITAIPALPAYHDTSLPVAIRARAYLDINCAHCHQAAGMAGNTSLLLGYYTSFDKTGIAWNKQNILIRMSTMGEIHMPKTGTTVIDEEGLKLIRQYMNALNSGK